MRYMLVWMLKLKSSICYRNTRINVPNGRFGIEIAEASYVCMRQTFAFIHIMPVMRSVSWALDGDDVQDFVYVELTNKDEYV